MNVSDFVAPGRCVECGRTRSHWTPQEIVNAARSWAEENGRPPRSKEWRESTPGWPVDSTVIQMFGTWNGMLEAAGLSTMPRGRQVWTRDLIAEAMLDFTFRHGRWPLAGEWYRGGAIRDRRPNTATVLRQFGTWNQAKRYAGWRTPEELKNAAERREAAQKRSHAKRRAKRASAAPPPALRTADSLGGGTTTRKVAA